MLPLVSCICISKNNKTLLQEAVNCFRYQAYSAKELLLVYEDDHPSLDYIDSLKDANIRKIRVAAGRYRLGGLRNMAVEQASGDYIAQWDDDDLYHHQRVEYQMMRLLDAQYDCCLLKKWMVYADSINKQLYVSGEYTWEGSIVVKKEVISQVGYYDVAKGEDLAVTDNLVTNYKTLKVDKPELYIYTYHGANTWDLNHFQSNIFCNSTFVGKYPDLRERYEDFFKEHHIDQLGQSSSPDISIVMLTRNSYETTVRCIESILKVIDSHIFKEFIILDNNSTDQTREYVKGLRHPKLRVILENQNLGVAKGRNILFKLAQGKIIASLDSDVVLTDIAYFYKCIDIFNKHEDVGMCGISSYVFNNWNFDTRFINFEGESFVDFISGCAQIFRSSCLDGVLLDERYSPFWLEDSDFCMQFKEKNMRMYQVPEFYGLYHDYRSRQHTSIELKNDHKSKWDYFCKKWGKSPIKREAAGKVNGARMRFKVATHFDHTFNGLSLIEKVLLTHCNPSEMSNIRVYSGNPLWYAQSICKKEFNVIILPFESSMIPEEWVDEINRSYDVCITSSSFLYSAFRNSGVSVPIHVIEQTFKRYQPVKKRRAYDVGGKMPFKLGVNCSTLTSRKNIRALIHACADLVEQGKNIVLYIHVSDDYFKLLDQEYNQEFIILNNRCFTDEEMGEWYGNLDCYIFPSSGEGWSMTPRESMFLGIPTIITDIPAHQELVDSGFYKCIHPCGGMDSYYEFLQRTCGQWSQYRKNDIAAAISDVVENYAQYSLKAAEGKLWVRDRWTEEDMVEDVNQALGFYARHPKIYSFFRDRVSAVLPERTAVLLKQISEKRGREYPGCFYRLSKRIIWRSVVRIASLLPVRHQHFLQKVYRTRLRDIPGAAIRFFVGILKYSLNERSSRKPICREEVKGEKEYVDIETEQFSFKVYQGYKDLNMNPTVLPYKTNVSDYIMLSRNETSIDDCLNSETYHILSYLDDNFNVVKQEPVTLKISDDCEFVKHDRSGLTQDCFILEDVRFIENSKVTNDAVLLYGVAMVEYKPRYLTKVALLELNLSEHKFYFKKFLEINENASVEKNWVIYQEGDQYYVIYKLGPPLIIYKILGDFDDFVMYKNIPYCMPANIAHMDIFDRSYPYHLSSFCDAGTHYLLLFHYFVVVDGGRKYYNSGIVLDKSTLEIKSRSLNHFFSELSFNIIFNMSVCRKENEYFFFCGIDDEEVALIRYDQKRIDDMFIPCEPEEAIGNIEYYNDGTNNDKWVMQDVFNYKKNGYYIEAGARDGIVGSSTYALEKYLGWTGLLVEPTKDYYQCVANRSASVCRKIVLAGEAGYDIFVHSNAMPLSGIKRNLLFMEKEYERRTNGRYIKNEYRTEQGIHSEQLMETITLEQLLDQINAPKTIDYLALDVEGSEYDILRRFDFDKYKILALAIEDDLCNELLLSKNYIKVENWHNKKQKWEQYFLHPNLHKKIEHRFRPHLSEAARNAVDAGAGKMNC